jgi:hypothetical protein
VPQGWIGQPVFVVKPTFNNLVECVTGMKVPVGQGLGLYERAANDPDHPILFLVKDHRMHITTRLAAEGVHFLGTIRVIEAARGRAVVVDLHSNMKRVLSIICAANNKVLDFRHNFPSVQLAAARETLRSGQAPGSLAMQAARFRASRARSAIQQYHDEQPLEGNLYLGGRAMTADIHYLMSLPYRDSGDALRGQGTLVLKLRPTQTPGLDWVCSLAGRWSCGHGHAADNCCCCTAVYANPTTLCPVSDSLTRCLVSSCNLVVARYLPPRVCWDYFCSRQYTLARIHEATIADGDH